MQGARQQSIEQAGELRSAPIESLRAIAALGVVVGHLFVLGIGIPTWLQDTYLGRVLYGGGNGVFLFFALTGYLLFWPFAKRDFAGGGRIDLATYARNRVLRILPLYFVAVALLLVIRDGGGDAGQWLRFATFTETLLADGEPFDGIDGPLWSVVVEVHFYVLLPAIALALAAVSRRRAGIAAGILIATGAVSLAVWQHKVNVAGADYTWRTNLPANWAFFVPGMLLALLRARWVDGPPSWLRGVAGSSTAWLAAGLLVWLVAHGDFERLPVLVAATFLIVGACVLPLRRGLALRGLSWRPLAVLGIASYSLYVWHLPLQEALAPEALNTFRAIALVSIPLCVAVALLSYRAIETPFLRLRRRWSPAAAPQEQESGPAPASAAPH